jgi:hypothetical protein
LQEVVMVVETKVVAVALKVEMAEVEYWYLDMYLN